MKNVLIKDLKKNDRIKGVYAIMQVINNINGLLTLYNEKTGIFFDADYRKYIKTGASVLVLEG